MVGTMEAFLKFRYKMTYSFIVPPELVSEIYKLREAGEAKSIRNFIIVAIEEKLKQRKKTKD